MEAIIVIVGFLGAGKTTLLKKLVEDAVARDWAPFVLLNDYENANLDAQQFKNTLQPHCLQALSGSCICCSGISELRESVNHIPKRHLGITLIEANGTTDACALMGFLGVGIDPRFLPPIQISVVDVKNWQKRGEHNALESNQIQVSSLLVLNHYDKVSKARINEVKQHLSQLNPHALIIKSGDLNISTLPEITPSTNHAEKFEHHKAHWASCSVDLPVLPDYLALKEMCHGIPDSILRIKGCTQIGKEQHYTYFERCPDGEIYVRPYHGEPTTGRKLLTIGPGSNINVLQHAINNTLSNAQSRC